MEDEGVSGGVATAGPYIAPAGEAGVVGWTPADPGPPDADTGFDCQEGGVASCGVERTGACAPELLRASVIGGVPPLEYGDAEGEENAKDGVAGAGIIPGFTLEGGELM